MHKRLVGFALAFLLACTSIAVSCPVTVRAASMLTSLGLTERGTEAYRDGWRYSFGGKGETVDGVRVSDCAGLICSYFLDNGNTTCMGGCTSQVEHNCVMSFRFSGRLPNIHGLMLTMYDEVDPDSGIYGHAGIYVGGGAGVDNSTYGTDMVWSGVAERGWTEWHLFDNGLMYPVDGWYEFDGAYAYYRDYEYVANDFVDGVYLDTNGTSLVRPESLSSKWATASEVREHLLSSGWADDGGIPTASANATVTGFFVNVRERPSTGSQVLWTASMGDKLEVIEETEGETVRDGSRVSNMWYHVTDAFGRTGYVSSLFLLIDGKPDTEPPGMPDLRWSDGSLVVSCPDGCSAYYTTDGSDPAVYGEPYVGPLDMVGCTYRVACERNGLYGPVALLTVCSDGSAFDDFTYKDWFAGYVDKAVSYGLFAGKGNRKFGPGDNMTRGQFTLVLARAMDADLGLVQPAGFVDVRPGSYYETAIDWAAGNGIVSGVGNNRFAPDEPITREQMCVMFARTYHLSSGEYEAFSDDGEISGWAREAVYACRDNGLVSGTGNNMFSPKGLSTRAQAATVFARTLDWVCSNKHDAHAGDSLRHGRVSYSYSYLGSSSVASSSTSKQTASHLYFSMSSIASRMSSYSPKSPVWGSVVGYMSQPTMCSSSPANFAYMATGSSAP